MGNVKSDTSTVAVKKHRTFMVSSRDFRNFRHFMNLRLRNLEVFKFSVKDIALNHFGVDLKFKKTKPTPFQRMIKAYVFQNFNKMFKIRRNALRVWDKHIAPRIRGDF